MQDDPVAPRQIEVPSLRVTAKVTGGGPSADAKAQVTFTAVAAPTESSGCGASTTNPNGFPDDCPRVDTAVPMS